MNDDYLYTPLRDEDELDVEEGFDHSGVDSGEDDDTYDFNVGDLQLGLIRYVGQESGGINVYELIFTKFIDDFWGENFNYQPASLCNGLHPDEKYIQKIFKIRTIIKLDLIQDCGCFSMQDCMDGCVALAWENLDTYESYPEDGRLVFSFGESYNYVETKLAKKHILL